MFFPLSAENYFTSSTFHIIHHNLKQAKIKRRNEASIEYNRISTTQMLLIRSSSTPLIQSHHCSNKHSSSFFSNSSPISQSNLITIRLNSLRRAQSDSNLHQPFLSSNSMNEETNSMLRTEPSFCIYNTEDGSEELSQEESTEFGEFSFGKKGMGLIEEDSDEEDEEGKVLNGIRNLGIEEKVVAEPGSPPMYLATGFGIDGNGVGGGGGGGGGDLKVVLGDDKGDLEEYYKRMVNEDPYNPLFLRNYAQLLQSKGDLLGAEEYYSRATLADPKDGEILMQYAKLVWELHHDQDRARSYFESAARASPQDSNVLAAHASFLWEVDEEDDDGDFAHNDHIQVKEDDSLIKVQNSTFEEIQRPVSPPLHLAAGLGIDMAGFSGPLGLVDYSAPLFGEVENVEEYYKKMIEENPCNPLVLRNYAQFLCQSKGDLEGAEEYYWRAVLADPTDGDIISQYAKLVWQLHHDQDKASSYFKQAVRAAPADCNVLAAYAGFLWETEDEEEYSCGQDHIEVPVFQGQDITPTHA